MVAIAGSSALAACARSGAPTARGTDVQPDAGVAWQDRIELASGPAVRGPWRQNESDYRWVDDASVDVTDSGEAAVVWVDQQRKDVFFQRYGAEGRTRLPAPVNVSKSASTFSWLPRIVVAPDDINRVHLLWQEIVFSGGSHGGEIFFARSSDGGRTFTEPVNLSNSVAGDGKGRLDKDTWDNGSLDLARSPEGDLYAAWTEYEGALWLRRSEPGSSAFGEAVRVAGTSLSPARGPSVAAAARGVVHVAWTTGENPSADVHIASSEDRGRSFGAARSIETTSGHSDAPKLVVDSSGVVHVVFAEAPNGRGGPYHVRYARLLSGAATFESPRRISLRAASESFPSVRVDAVGRVYVLWETVHAGEDRPRGLAFTVSTDGGARFAEPTDVPGVAAPARGWNGSQQGMLTEKLAVAPAGTIAVVNGTFDPGRTSHVWLVRGRLSEAGIESN